MVIIDHVAIAVLFAGRLPPAREGQHARSAEEAFQRVIVKTNPQTVTDQPRGNEHVTQQKAAAAGHGNLLFGKIVRASRRQGPKLGPLDLQQLASEHLPGR